MREMKIEVVPALPPAQWDGEPFFNVGTDLMFYRKKGQLSVWVRSWQPGMRVWRVDEATLRLFLEMK